MLCSESSSEISIHMKTSFYECTLFDIKKWRITRKGLGQPDIDFSENRLEWCNWGWRKRKSGSPDSRVHCLRYSKLRWRKFFLIVKMRKNRSKPIPVDATRWVECEYANSSKNKLKLKNNLEIWIENWKVIIFWKWFIL